jgi:ketosteroid isomerase-like protein
MSIIRTEDGKIREHRTYDDPLVFAELLGVTDE